MGVTLERVQNKFACIIGELCSEPVILSQFAIWLDLRLAEYKAKGAISLDCSGDNPDPVWLNGHRLPPAKTHPRDRHSGRFGALSSAKPMSQHRDISWSRLSAERGSSEGGSGYDPQAQPVENLPSVEERLSPQGVMVKEEPSDTDRVFPISLHRHEVSEPRMQMQNRKRTAAETIASSHEMLSSDSHSPISSSTPKIRRVSSPGDADINPPNSDPAANQSLMSIISGEMPEHPTETVDLTETDINIIMDYENKEDLSQSRENSRPPFTSHSSAASGSEFPARSEDSINTDHVRGPGFKMFPPEGVGPQFPVGQSLPGQVLPERFNNRSIRARIVNVSQKPDQTIGNLVSAVGTLERWMWKKHGEERLIEDMPVEVLDSYLVGFFTHIKKPDGRDYSSESLLNLRGFLERFLREKGYPSSISKSAVFSRSQTAFKQRRRKLSPVPRPENRLVFPHSIPDASWRQFSSVTASLRSVTCTNADDVKKTSTQANEKTLNSDTH
ncbi:uncharacterized protein LOC135463325 [Liolophura sinensis]|uniref:uncharacterized protein LOC135463325 n=1 Tax=Liolophura sinensis TaxID=3198878 RepID=UPI00315808CF